MSQLDGDVSDSLAIEDIIVGSPKFDAVADGSEFEKRDANKLEETQGSCGHVRVKEDFDFQ